MNEAKVVEKVVRLHYGVDPIKSDWYYCVIADWSGNTDSDVIFYDSLYGEWQHRRNEKIICWMEPLYELLEKE